MAAVDMPAARTDHVRMPKLPEQGVPDEDELYVLEWVFTEGEAGRGADAGVQRRQSIGELHLPTGRILACDPMLLQEEPLGTLVEPGSYPVTLCLKDGLPAFLDVRVREGQVRHWRAMSPHGIPPHDPATRTVWGYGVESATGAMMDASLVTDPVLMQPDGEEPRLYTLVTNARREDQPWWVTEVRTETGAMANVIAVDVGSDGDYACYAGYGDDGELLRVVNDLGAYYFEDSGA